MIEMEQFQQNSHKLEGEGETDGQYNGEGSEGNSLDGEVLEVSYDVGNKIILHQPELCAIYTAIYWAWKPDGTPWSEIEIKQIVGHAILGLDEDSYHRLDLSDVIKLFHNEKDDLTRAVKPIAEELKSILVSWIPQQYEKYLDLCRQDIRSVTPLWLLNLCN